MSEIIFLPADAPTARYVGILIGPAGFRVPSRKRVWPWKARPHGDTVSDMLDELVAQARERGRRAD